MPRPSNTAQRRDEIADAMIRVMAAVGYERATVAAIAATAGIVPGLVHYHFRSKHQVLELALDRLAMRVDARSERLANRAGADPLARIDALVDAHLALGEGADPTATACWVAFAAAAVEQPVVRELWIRVQDSRLMRLTALFEAALSTRRRDTAAARAIAAAALSAIDGALHLGLTGSNLVPAGFASPAIKAMIRGSLDAQPCAPEQDRRSDWAVWEER